MAQDFFKVNGGTADINSNVNAMKKVIAENALTLLNKTDDVFFPLKPNDALTKIAYVSLGTSTDNEFSKKLRSEYKADVFYINYKHDAGRVLSLVELIKKRYKKVIIGVHNYARVPINNFGISPSAVDLVTQLQNQTNAITFVFGNPYALQVIPQLALAKEIVLAYQDFEVFQEVAAQQFIQNLACNGQLPVAINNL